MNDKTDKKLIKSYGLRLTLWSLLFLIIGYLLAGLSYYDCDQCIEPYKSNHQVWGLMLSYPTIRKDAYLRIEFDKNNGLTITSDRVF